jgi:hypothetical protein
VGVEHIRPGPAPPLVLTPPQLGLGFAGKDTYQRLPMLVWRLFTIGALCSLDRTSNCIAATQVPPSPFVKQTPPPP